MSDFIHDNPYVIAEDTDGRLYFYIDAKKESPQKYPNPKIIYDGKEQAILQRRPAQDIVFNYINEDMRESLKNMHSVMIVESINQDITQAYYANMELVEDLII